MASLTKFTIGPSGELVYKSTGKLAPSNYTFRKNTVYKVGADGVKRRVGSLSRKLTKTQAAKIAKAAKSRNARFKRDQKFQRINPKTGKPRSPPKQAKWTAHVTLDDTPDSKFDIEFQSTEFPEATQAVKEEFASRVRAAAVSVAPASLKAKIQALSTEAIYQAYTEDAFIFELYFRYHHEGEAPRTSDVSVWLYQFVNRVEQYMGVTA